jgi:enamine deaminase RidA (YjgF/YER057c/UK114 family)
MSLLTPINPPALGPPKGFTNGLLAPPGCSLLFVAGQVAWDDQQQIIDGDFVDQMQRALENMMAVVQEAGGAPENVARLTCYVTDRDEYLGNLQRIGQVWRAVMGYHFPAMTLVQVAALVDPKAKVEVEATAVLPPCETEEKR